MLYRPEIDGLRALAVLAVILFHAAPSVLTGGYLGVDVFFVISGYLITAIILNERAQQRFSLLHFYERRARRILPALFFMMFACFPLASVWLNPDDKMAFLQSAIASSAFVSNIFFWLQSGYFEQAASLKPLLHSWTLGVEGQFYLIYPLMLLLLWKCTHRVSLGLLTLSAIISLMLASFVVRNAPDAAFYLLPTRLWEFLVGALSAWFPYSVGRKALAAILSFLGFAMVTAALTIYTPATPTPGLLTLMPVAGTALLLRYASKGNLIGRLLCLSPLVGIGRISYSAYLWHWPLLVFLNHMTLGLYGLPQLGAVLAATFVLAYLSYRYVETPFRRNQPIPHKQVLLLLIVLPVALIALASRFFLQSGELEQRADANRQKYLDAMKDERFTDAWHDGSLPMTLVTHQGIDPKILFFGDSHAQHYGPLIAELRKTGLLEPTLMLSGGGCPPFPHVYEDRQPWCSDQIQRFEEILQQMPSIEKIILAACFNCYFLEETIHPKPWNARYDYYYQDGSDKADFRGQDGSQKAFDAFVDFTKKLSDRYEVAVILDNPSSEQFNPKVALQAINRATESQFARRYPDYSPARFPYLPTQQALSERLKSAFAGSNIRLFNTAAEICPQGICRAHASNGKPIYKDANHMRPFFVQAHFAEIKAFFLARRNAAKP